MRYFFFWTSTLLDCSFTFVRFLGLNSACAPNKTRGPCYGWRNWAHAIGNGTFHRHRNIRKSFYPNACLKATANWRPEHAVLHCPHRCWTVNVFHSHAVCTSKQLRVVIVSRNKTCGYTFGQSNDDACATFRTNARWVVTHDFHPVSNSASYCWGKC